MAISFVGTRFLWLSGSTSVGGSLDLTLLTQGSDTAARTDDLVIVAYSTGATADRTLAITNSSAVDYTLIDSELYSNDVEDTNLRVAYRFMPNPAETEVLLGPTGNASEEGVAHVMVFRGVDLVTPLDVAAVPATGVDTRYPDPAAITPVTTGAWVYVVGAGAQRNGFGSQYTTGLTPNLTTVNHGIHVAAIGAGYVMWTGGAYNPNAFTGGFGGSVDESWAAMTVALRPSALVVASPTKYVVRSAMRWPARIT